MKAVQKSPAFSFYAKDFLTGTATMSLAERGAYVTLLAYEWDAGSVPGQASARARVLGCTAAQERSIWLKLESKFVARDGVFLNARLETERAKQILRRQALAQNGSKGGSKTAAKTQQLLQQQAEQNSNLPSSSSEEQIQPPQPPAGAGGSVRVRREHRENAKAILRAQQGYCKHDQPCVNQAACCERLALEIALKAKAS